MKLLITRPSALDPSRLPAAIISVPVLAMTIGGVVVVAVGEFRREFYSGRNLVC